MEITENMANATATKSMRLSETTAQEWEKIKSASKNAEEAMQTLIAAYMTVQKNQQTAEQTSAQHYINTVQTCLDTIRQMFTQQTADVQCALKDAAEKAVSDNACAATALNEMTARANTAESRANDAEARATAAEERARNAIRLADTTQTLVDNEKREISLLNDKIHFLKSENEKLKGTTVADPEILNQ